MFFNARESHIEPLEFVGQTSVVDSETVQKGRLQVMNVDGGFRDVVAEVIGLPVAETGLHAATGHEKREASWVMITSRFGTLEITLAGNPSSKFTSPDDQRVIQ
jgi:hypothetical protein